MEYSFLYNGDEHSAKVEKGKNAFKVGIGDRVLDVSALMLSPGLLSLIIDGQSVLAHTARDCNGSIVCINGVQWSLGNADAEDDASGAGSTQGGDGVIKTPMPGKIVEVHVKEGDSVEKNQPLLVLEAMKMQSDIISDVSGVVKKVLFKPGDQANFGEPLVEIEPADE